MHTEKEHIDPDELAKMGYERRDINIPALRKTVLIFYGFAIGSALFAAFVLYQGVRIGPLRIDPYVAKTTVQQKNEAANAVGRILPPPPYPLLQGNVTAKLDLQTMRQAEDARLAGTGYVDADKTRAFIPVDRAMDLILERGLPKTGTEDAVTKGNDMEPFGTRTVPQPDRSGPTGDATMGTPTNPAPVPPGGVPQNPMPRPAERMEPTPTTGGAGSTGPATAGTPPIAPQPSTP